MANQRKHGATHEIVVERWEAKRGATHSTAVLRTPYVDEETRKVARDAFVRWNNRRYSVPLQYGGKEVRVRPQHTVNVFESSARSGMRSLDFVEDCVVELCLYG